MTQESEAEARLYGHTHELFKSHRKLLSDATRNRAFYSALAQCVNAQAHVLDIGSGTGIWAIAAARLGARRVVAVEEDALLIGLIRELARENGVLDRVEAVAGNSLSLQLGREFDVVVSETIGNLAFDEQIVPVMADARQRFLKPGGTLIPHTMALMAAAASLSDDCETLPADVPLEFAKFRSLDLNMPVVVEDRTRLTMLTPGVELLSVDLRTAEAPPVIKDVTARWEIAQADRVNCIVVWAQALLTDTVRISTLETTSWAPHVYRVTPFGAGAGTLEFSLTLTSATNYWTATFYAGSSREMQSYSPAFAAAEVVALSRGETLLPANFNRRATIVSKDESEE